MTEISRLIQVMKSYPDLTIDGIGGDRRDNFKQRRAELLGAIEPFEAAIRWLRAVPRRETPNRRCDSYFVKHAAERWAREYIPNGALIAAAIALDFPVRRCPSGINVWIGVASPRSWPKDHMTQ